MMSELNNVGEGYAIICSYELLYNPRNKNGNFRRSDSKPFRSSVCGVRSFVVE